MVNLKEHQKLLYLTRLLQIYTRFLKAYSNVDVEIVEREKILVNRSVRKRLIYGDNEIEVEVLIPYETDIPKTRYIRIIYKDVIAFCCINHIKHIFVADISPIIT